MSMNLKTKLLTLVTVVLATMMPTKLWAQEPYAVLSDNNTPY